jgi:hypothetical protein
LDRRESSSTAGGVKIARRDLEQLTIEIGEARESGSHLEPPSHRLPSFSVEDVQLLCRGRLV